jgi:hypothetical protein
MSPGSHLKRRIQFTQLSWKHLPTIQIHRPLASNRVAWFHHSLSSLDPPLSVRQSEGDQGQLVSRVTTTAWAQQAFPLAQHRDPGWVLVLFLYRSRAYLSGTDEEIAVQNNMELPRVSYYQSTRRQPSNTRDVPKSLCPVNSLAISSGYKEVTR